ncbi:PQQ-like beta-propeller repeat protein [Chondromyces crocatus]|nr:PQQ-like beta-propeller repeat protein [Chondromyces crocatus]
MGAGFSREKAPRALSKRRAAMVLGALTLPALATMALAEDVSTSRPATVVVGAPRGFAASDRLDARRTGSTWSALPVAPKELWRRHISGGMDASPLIDADGNVVATLTVPEVVKLGPEGRELWRVRIGSNAPLAPATLTSDGTLLLVTSAGVAWGLSPQGAVRFTTQLGVRGRDADVTPLALEDGGVVIAAGRSLVELSASGAVRGRAELQERAVGAVLAGPEGALVTTEPGEVLVWRRPGAPRRLGSFGGAPRRGAALADARTLLAVVDGRRLVGLDLRTGATSTRASGATGVGAFDAPPAVGAGGVAITGTAVGLLLGVDAAGGEPLRVAIDRPPPSIAADAGAGLSSFLGAVEGKPSPPVVVDAEGRVGFVRSAGRAGVVQPDGSVALATERVCATPVAVLPAGKHRMLVACRDGTLVMMGD